MRPGWYHGYCFACRFKQTWIDAVAQRVPGDRRQQFRAAVDALADRGGLPRPAWQATQHEAVDGLTAAAQWLRAQLVDRHDVAQACRAYLQRRQIGLDVVELLPLGCLPSPALAGRVLRQAGCTPGAIKRTGLTERYMRRYPLIFIATDGEKITGFKGRSLVSAAADERAGADPRREAPKALNAKGFGGEREARSLYCLDLAKDAIAASGRVILVEGEFDALVWQAWFLRRTQVIELVAWGGTSKPKPESFARLRALGARIVYLANDDDPAGHAATRECVRLAWAAGLEPLVMTMPPGCKDPDEVFTRLGPEVGMQALNAGIVAPVSWLVRHWAATHALATGDGPAPTAAGIAHVRAQVAEVGAVAPASVIEELATDVATLLDVSAASVMEDIQRAADEARRDAALRALRAWTAEAHHANPATLAETLARGQNVFQQLVTAGRGRKESR
jgi:DNA primase